MWIGDLYLSAGWIIAVICICAAHLIAAKFGVRLGDGLGADRLGRNEVGVAADGQLTGVGPRLVTGLGAVDD
jgi:hypothetical protein